MGVTRAEPLEHAHRAAIEVLRKANAALREELREETRLSIAPATSSGAALVSQLQDESDALTRKVGLRGARLRPCGMSSSAPAEHLD